MVVELFLDLLSQPCRAVFIFAKKNNIPFEFKHVELLKGHHLSEEFGKVNVLKKVPALKDGWILVWTVRMEVVLLCFCFCLYTGWRKLWGRSSSSKHMRYS
uniref:GST N-terminal domain-containing protein n=1 Tax=Chelonoidis abingdonii TaxID=106734 RepID=A0A8C0GCA5_CHEAB